MWPWLAAAAGLLSANQKADEARTEAAAGFRQRAAKRLGGDGGPMEAVGQKQAIERQHSNDLTDVFINTLVGQLGKKAAPQGNEAWREPMSSKDQQAALYPESRQGPLGAVRADADERAQALEQARRFYGR